jgi:hypothetical protein
MSGQLQEQMQSGARLQSGSGVHSLECVAAGPRRVPELRFVRQQAVPA